MSAGKEKPGKEKCGDPEPDIVDVHQEEPEDILPVPSVPVTVDGPVRTQQLPTRTASMRSIRITGTEVIAGEDDRRASVTLVARSGTEGFYVGTSSQMVASGEAAFFDSNIPVTLRTTERLYARSSDGTTMSHLTVVQELWAD